MLRKLYILVLFTLGLFQGAYAQFSGGNNDGFTVGCFSQANNPMQDIYAGGNNDGFTVSCYAQADNPLQDIYAGGSNDGFAFSCVGSLGSEVPLPIVLLSFKGKSKEGFNHLEWQTASEINNDYFTLEKSKDTRDFIPVTTVNGGENSNNILNYNAIDNTPYKGTSYYRLKQTDFDGTYSYSQIIALDNSSQDFKFSVYPNPVVDYLHIDFGNINIENVIVKITNSLGIIVEEISVNQLKHNIDMSAYSKGVYYLEIFRNKEKVQNIKCIKIIK